MTSYNLCIGRGVHEQSTFEPYTTNSEYVLTMRARLNSDSEASESTEDRIRRNDKYLTDVKLYDWDIEILDALKNNSVVKYVSIFSKLLPENQEAHVKLSEVMKCNKSVESLTISF